MTHELPSSQLIAVVPKRVLRSLWWRSGELIASSIKPHLVRTRHVPGGRTYFDHVVDKIQRQGVVDLVNLVSGDLLDPLLDPEIHYAASSTECLSNALTTYPVLAEHEGFAHSLRQLGLDYGVSPMAALYRLEHPLLQRLFPLPSLAPFYRRLWPRLAPPACLAADRTLLAPGSQLELQHGPAILRFSERPFGVNLIGHAFNIFGMGEEIRMAARALLSAEVPFCVIDRPVANGSPTTDRSLETFINANGGEGPYAFNLVCMAADQHALWLCREGLGQQRNRYTITDWPWETSHWPAAATPILPMADEFWPFSNFVGQALMPFSEDGGHASGVPMRVITPATAIEEPERFCSPEAKLASRSHFSLPRHGLLFVFAFDLNSLIARKNPMAVITAFQAAFPIGAEGSVAVGLVVKTFPPRQPNQEWDTLKSLAAADSRIHIVEADLDRSEILSLYGCCDVFISLHRSEGLGRGLTEALQLGLDVVATDYGGNTDFCRGPLAHRVPYRLVPIREGEYPHPEGQVWAEPDGHEAAVILRRVAEERSLRAHTPPEITDRYRRQFSAATVGTVYRKRLEEIWSRRFSLDADLAQRHAAW